MGWIIIVAVVLGVFLFATVLIAKEHNKHSKRAVETESPYAARLEELSNIFALNTLLINNGIQPIEYE